MKKNLSIFMTAGSWLQRALALFLCVAALEAVQAAPQDTKRTITGTVVDQNNLPVVGATVMISNSANGTATDSNGQFTLSGVTDNDELQISFLGYKTVTMQIGTRTAIAATLEEDSGYLDEVVVVGYGTTTRRHIISAVSTVKSEAIENRPVANIQQALQGAAANLIIQTKNFNPTDNQMNISIRGVNTMGNNTPLVVIDGVPQPDAGRMNDLNPNDQHPEGRRFGRHLRCTFLERRHPDHDQERPQGDGSADPVQRQSRYREPRHPLQGRSDLPQRDPA